MTVSICHGAMTIIDISHALDCISYDMLALSCWSLLAKTGTLWSTNTLMQCAWKVSGIFLKDDLSDSLFIKFCFCWFLAFLTALLFLHECYLLHAWHVAVFCSCKTHHSTFIHAYIGSGYKRLCMYSVSGFWLRIGWGVENCFQVATGPRLSQIYLLPCLSFSGRAKFKLHRFWICHTQWAISLKW